ncbi:hypothetical protein LPJ74_000939 [Coemansia sp. RSA 1843]|nr:hypothetical protein LPJ74_000939 [Coemansia sp. RSA 1843]
MLGHKAPHLVFDFNPTADSIRHKTDNIISQERDDTVDAGTDMNKNSCSFLH